MNTLQFFFLIILILILILILIFFFPIYNNVRDNKKNCYKCNLETINDPNNHHFWVNLRDFEVETERNWVNIFN